MYLSTHICIYILFQTYFLDIRCTNLCAVGKRAMFYYIFYIVKPIHCFCSTAVYSTENVFIIQKMFYLKAYLNHHKREWKCHHEWDNLLFFYSMCGILYLKQEGVECDCLFCEISLKMCCVARLKKYRRSIKDTVNSRFPPYDVCRRHMNVVWVCWASCFCSDYICLWLTRVKILYLALSSIHLYVHMLGCIRFQFGILLVYSSTFWNTEPYVLKATLYNWHKVRAIGKSHQRPVIRLYRRRDACFRWYFTIQKRRYL